MHWQVFGLVDTGSGRAHLPGAASQVEDPVRVAPSVSTHRCGAVPDLHRYSLFRFRGPTGCRGRTPTLHGYMGAWASCVNCGKKKWDQSGLGELGTVWRRLASTLIDDKHGVLFVFFGDSSDAAKKMTPQ